MCKPILDVCCGSRMFYFDKNTLMLFLWIVASLRKNYAMGENLKLSQIS